MASIGAQMLEQSGQVENTVATAQGGITTGQGKNVAGHMVLPLSLVKTCTSLKTFDIVNTNGARDAPDGGALPRTLQHRMPVMEYSANLCAIALSIPMDDNSDRHVRLHMFVRGPYMGLHRYVASVKPIELTGGTSSEAGAAFKHDMRTGLLDPVSLYWRPALFGANYYGLGYYSFNVESAMIYAELQQHNGEALQADRVDVNAIMRARYRWQALAAYLGFVYPLPALHLANERANPFQWPIVGRAIDGVVREYP